MKKIFLSMCALTLLVTGLHAQDSKIETGVVSFQQQDWGSAIKALDAGLADPSILKPKNVPRGYYYRAQARMMLTQSLGAEIQKKMNAKDTVGAEAVGKQMVNNLKLIIADYRKAKETDAEGKWGKDIENNMRIPRMIVIGMVEQTLQQLRNDEIMKKASEEDYKELSDLIVPLLDELILLEPNGYLGYDLRGQTKNALKDPAGAQTDYELAMKKFKEAPPEQPDMEFGRTFLRSSILYKESKNADKALQMLGDGKAVVEAEFKRMETKKQYIADSNWKKIENSKNDLINRLSVNELAILMEMPDKMNEAVARFDKAIADKPQDYNLHINFASLLEKVDSTRAIRMYEKAMAIDPKRTSAYNNLGAFYNGKAKEFHDKLKATEDERLMTAYKSLRDQNFQLAKPQFEKALELEPRNIEYVKALKQIAIFLNDEPGMIKYGDLEKQIRSGQ